ncbi:MAG: HDIG domain-containing protein [Chitinophagales bacterium]|nr:HDIG domain-containing protein [Chitinophagales bacterium]
MMNPKIEATIDEIFTLYEKYGRADYIGEAISQIEHMSQAAQLAERDGFDDEVILAAFFHDIGQICVNESQYHDMGGFGNQEHEKVGGEFLRRRGFSEKVASLAENHVDAKRYLTYKYPEYYNKLTEASKETLRYQGGPMSKEEAEAFEQSPYFKESVKLREYDEAGKEIGIPLVDMGHMKHLVRKHLTEQLKHAL